jgi:integrase/recombinase XerD
MSSRSPVRVSGPLADYAAGFGVRLEGSGYRPASVASQLWLLVYVSRWLGERGLGAADLTAARVEQFSMGRRASGRTWLYSSRALDPLLEYLRGLGIAPAAVETMALTPVDVLAERYGAYLVERRGLSSSTVRNYVALARVFLSWRETAGGTLSLAGLDSAAVIRFVLGEAGRCSVGSATCLVTRLRAFLRFLHVEGEIDRDLSGAVPSVASWRLAGLVKALDPGSLARLLASCDRRTRVGRRDFAVLMLLSRLGLRAGEVSALRVCDVDWRGGEVMIRGKGNRRERLPLPADVGEALAGWLARGRPRCECVFVFTKVRAPLGRLSPGGVSAIVQRASRRAGLPVVCAHRLRHTAATEMLRAGGNLTEIGQVLRHRSRDVTSIYAKVDRSALAAVVMPWPGAAA